VAVKIAYKMQFLFSLSSFLYSAGVEYECRQTFFNYIARRRDHLILIYEACFANAAIR